MSLPRYPEYKDRGVEWLGEAPAHWRSCKLKHLCSFTTGWTPPTGDSSAYEGSNLWANISDLGEKVISATAKRISDGAVSKANICISPEGSLLFSFKLSVGQVSIAGCDMYTNEAIATFKKSDLLLTEYAYYALPVFVVRNASENIYGAKLLNQALINSAKVVVPAVDEQREIAAFLDRETTKIDTLIAEQEKLLALLAEKRQATISHAVTRGLNPNAPMKDSGIAWLGEVPAHWSLQRLKTLSEFTTSGPRGWSEKVGEDGSLFIQSGDLNSVLGVDFDNAKRVVVEDDAEALRTRMKDGDVLVCITGAKTGNVAVCETVPEAAYVNQHLCLVRPATAVLPAFLATVLKSGVGKVQFELAQYGLKQGLSLENVREVLVVLPSLQEQEAIAAFLDAEARRFDALQSEAQSAIFLLKERRSALIAAAVTGKIDVRCATVETPEEAMA